MLDAELTEHLGYEKYLPEGRNSGNSRNGKTHKTLKNDNGEIDITVQRDRNGSFDPLIVKKYERTPQMNSPSELFIWLLFYNLLLSFICHLSCFPKFNCF